MKRLYFYRNQTRRISKQYTAAGEANVTWGIITPPHTLFIANTMAKHLVSRGINVEILTSTPKTYEHKLYIVLCAQIFKKLPPEEKRIIFQLEQSTNKHWFTDEYINSLKNSLAVLEYSLLNIKYLAENGIRYPNIYHLPIGASTTNSSPNNTPHKKYDFIFYGDVNSSQRRQKILKEFKKKYNVLVCNDTFGEEMTSLIEQSKAVINIHYHDDALLETPRIQECLSLGVPVLSESSKDKDNYPELTGAVLFFEENSVDDMVMKASDIMEKISDYTLATKEAARLSASNFSFMFDRFLAGLGAISATDILDRSVYLQGEGNLIALSLPETIDRRNIFLENKPQRCLIFDGIRNVRGWIGCGSSFRALAHYAKENKITQLTVMEDDASLPKDFDEKMETIQQYLNQRTDEWDVFSGMMADVHPNAKIYSIEKWNGINFITIDRMTSTVCNIYNLSALNMLTKWDPTDLNVDHNTIDRYLDRQNKLRVVVALPFLVNHREEATSTLWEFENSQYSSMIKNAELQLKNMSEAFLKKNSKLY